MGSDACSLRALWVLNNQDAVVFSRKFSVVEKQWRAACLNDGTYSSVYTGVPSDSEFSAAFASSKKREGSMRGYGLRVPESVLGSDSWIDEPITRHVISIRISNLSSAEDDSLLLEHNNLPILWPLIFHVRGIYSVLVLPLVEPRHLKEYRELCEQPGCGNAIGMDKGLSSILLDLPSITGAFMVAQAIADVITGETIDAEIVSASPVVSGLLDSLTGSIGIAGISSRTKSVATPAASAMPLGINVTGAVHADALKIGYRPLDKDLLRNFIIAAMPFGTPLDLNYTNILSIRTNGFSSSETPPADLRQPAWKPYLYKGKQRILFTIHETVHAAVYDQDDIEDTINVSGQINCRAELEGLPDVSLPLTALNKAQVEVMSFHHCAQVPEHGADKQAVMFSPPVGNFVLLRYLAKCGSNPPVKGFYQLSMVSEDEGAFLFKLMLVDGYKSSLTMEFCNVTMPFPKRRIISFDGTPSIGVVSTTEHSVEWKIISTPRNLSGKRVEATFPGTIKFAPVQKQCLSPAMFGFGNLDNEEVDVEVDGICNTINVEEFLMEKMSKCLPPTDLEEPFCWQAYSYAKVSFKFTGTSVTGISIDPKSVSIYPAVKAPVELTSQVSSGDYILWNTLGKCPSALKA